MKTGLIDGCKTRMHALCLAAICGVMVVSGFASGALAQDNENAAAELTSGTTAESVAGATERAVGEVDPAPAGPPVEAAGTGGEDFSIASQVTIQAIGVDLTVAWIGVVSVIAFLIARPVFGLRVSEDAERERLDITSHGESAYQA